jgi:hypothetical protein
MDVTVDVAVAISVGVAVAVGLGVVVGVLVVVGVGVAAAVAVAVGVAVLVGVGAEVEVGVLVVAGVGVAVLVGVGAEVEVGVLVVVGVGVAAAVAVAVGAAVGVAVGVLVGVWVGVSVGVAVAVGVGVGADSTTTVPSSTVVSWAIISVSSTVTSWRSRSLCPSPCAARLMTANSPVPLGPGALPPETAAKVTWPASLSMMRGMPTVFRPVLPRKSPSVTSSTVTMAGVYSRSNWKPPKSSALSIITETVKLSSTVTVDWTGSIRTVGSCRARCVSRESASAGAATTSVGRRNRVRKIISQELRPSFSILLRSWSNLTALIFYQSFRIRGR